MNKKLRKLYLSKKIGLDQQMKVWVNRRGANAPTNPFLIRLPQEKQYESSKIRIMIFGKETNNWEGRYSLSVDGLLDVYEEFFANQLGLTDEKKYSSVFWNYTKYYVNRIEETLRLFGPLQYVWNNTLKIGRANDKGSPANGIIDILEQYFNVLSKEIEILNPNIIIFFTGPDYDSYLKRFFPEIVFSEVSKAIPDRQLARISCPKLPFLSFRTYHPNYLNRKNELRKSVERAILKLIKKNKMEL